MQLVFRLMKEHKQIEIKDMNTSSLANNWLLSIKMEKHSLVFSLCFWVSIPLLLTSDPLFILLQNVFLLFYLVSLTSWGNYIIQGNNSKAETQKTSSFMSFCHLVTVNFPLVSSFLDISDTWQCQVLDGQLTIISNLNEERHLFVQCFIEQGNTGDLLSRLSYGLQDGILINL